MTSWLLKFDELLDLRSKNSLQNTGTTNREKGPQGFEVAERDNDSLLSSPPPLPHGQTPNCPHVHLCVCPGCGEAAVEVELSTYLEIRPNALEFLQVIFPFKQIYSSTLLLVLLLAPKGYLQFGK